MTKYKSKTNYPYPMPASKKQPKIDITEDVAEYINMLNSKQSVHECDANGLNQGTEPMANNSLEETTEPEKRELFGFNQPWSLPDVLNKLIEASEILLDKKNYDGHGWEEIYHAVGKAKEYSEQIMKYAGDSSKGGDLEVSDRSPDVDSVASHTSSSSNSNHQ